MFEPYGPPLSDEEPPCGRVCRSGPKEIDLMRFLVSGFRSISRSAPQAHFNAHNNLRRWLVSWVTTPLPSWLAT